ncbi:NAD-dependent epimerase/dehydratase family protein [Kitasatospora sp. NPDC057015]|uniref:NAD-dependent epimerase/dehydratase family protein n=1 Tax=Kitasatospora sp. NPDC057015 TaxID=3346001 RepID=UPI003641BE3B
MLRVLTLIGAGPLNEAPPQGPGTPDRSWKWGENLPQRPLLLVTGARGVLGSLLRPTLRDQYSLRVSDRDAAGSSGPDEVLVGDLTDPGFATEAVAGVDAILHLAAYASPRAPWPAIAPNIAMTHNVLAAAEHHSIDKVVLASSNHAAGLNYRDGECPVDPAAAPRPCCAYGTAKLAEEALGRLHAVRTGASVMSIRFGLVGWALAERDYNAMWLSDRDAAALVGAVLRSPVGHGVYFGMSRHAEAFWSLANARTDLGWKPRDVLPARAESLPWAPSPPCLMFDPHTTGTTAPTT